VSTLGIASGIAGILGGMLRGRNQSDAEAEAIRARNAVTRAELDRQRRFGARAGGAFRDSLSGFDADTQAGRLDAGQNDAIGLLLANAPDAATVGPFGFGGSQPAVADAESKAVTDALAKGATDSTARGNLLGWGELNRENQSGLDKYGRRIDKISDFSRNSASLAELERAIAGNNTYRPPSTLADLLTFAGTVGGYRAGEGRSLFNWPTPTLQGGSRLF
jgi:hypothetical protein